MAERRSENEKAPGGRQQSETAHVGRQLRMRVHIILERHPDMDPEAALERAMAGFAKRHNATVADVKRWLAHEGTLEARQEARARGGRTVSARRTIRAITPGPAV